MLCSIDIPAVSVPPAAGKQKKIAFVVKPMLEIELVACDWSINNKSVSVYTFVIDVPPLTQQTTNSIGQYTVTVASTATTTVSTTSTSNITTNTAPGPSGISFTLSSKVVNVTDVSLNTDDVHDGQGNIVCAISH